MPTTDEYMRRAWQALLAGDLAERDRNCELAKDALEAEKKVKLARGLARLMDIDFFVTKRGTVIPTTKMMPRA